MYVATADTKRRRLDQCSVAKVASSSPSSLGRVVESRTYTAQRILGKGSFGVVYQAQVIETGDIVAIKSVRFQESDREVQILKELDGHPNIVCLRGAFLSTGGGSDQESKLNLVLEYLSDTLHRVIKHCNRLRQGMGEYYIRLYQYQLLRALAFVHGKGILHCDIKPQNLLLEGRTHSLKLCDFGTARRTTSIELARPYVCSRYYRAPELTLGAVGYNTAVDLWSAGCVFAEMILGQPLFTGRDGIHQLVEIIKVLGTPTSADLQAMNPSYPAYDFSPTVEALPWDKVFKGSMTPEGNDLAGQLMCYDPAARLPPLYAMAHRFFEPLREDSRPLHRTLFEFLPEELWMISVTERQNLVPSWMRTS